MRILGEVNDHARGLLRHLDQGLVDGGHGGRDPLTQVHVVEADDGDVFGDGQAGVLDRPVAAVGLLVGAVEDCRRRVVQGEEPRREPVAALEQGVAGDDELGVVGDLVAAEDGAVGVKAVLVRDEVHRAGYVGDPAVTEGDQMLCGVPRARPVRGRDGGDIMALVS
ncbi:hypothetical protein DRB06_04240 [Actinomyces sp. Z5]|nr:hypothetical protein DRB06_04240 [Actinomyces sp. Z5]